MSLIKPLTETAETVTLSRADFEALLAAREDAVDLAALRAEDVREARLGAEAARADYLPIALVDRLLAGESPVRIWREHRGQTQRGLAKVAGISVSYLSEVESGRKPGSAVALRALAQALRVPMEDLVPAAAACGE
jgi:DNA-binding XRE family transcriptional regulator